MNLIRKYKIYKSFNIIDNETKEILDFIDYKLYNLKIYNEYDGYFYYINSNNKVIMVYNIKNKCLYVRDENFCGILKDKFNLNYDNILNIITFKVKNIYKIELDRFYNWMPIPNILEIEETCIKNEFNKEI